jgi:transcriptional regulator with PAS, ATPase and Fis domain
LFLALSCASPLEPPSRHALEGIDEVRFGRGRQRATSRGTDEGRRLLHLTLTDARVSSAHARLVPQCGTWHLEDLGSKNGCFVNGSPVGTAALADGDSIQIGQTIFILRTGLPTPSSTPIDQVATGQVPALATLLPSLARELDLLARAALSSLPVLLVSETGTGKELLARALHTLSRRQGRFVPVNCGALTQTLLESALFGHKRGAFSGAVADHPGLFRAANGGTLLLDELGDMSLPAQAAVLRTLQDGEVLPVGETEARLVDVRIVCATHRNLERLIAEGGFREDLFARLSGFTFRLPPLRERREDIGLMIGAILRRDADAHDKPWSLSMEAGMRLLGHSWPQNVRELEKAILRATALKPGDRLEVEHLPDALRQSCATIRVSSDEQLKARLVVLLGKNRGNLASVATAMRTSRSQLHRWLKRFAIRVDEFRP